MLTEIQGFLTARGWQFDAMDDDTVATAFTISLPDGADQPFPLYILRVEDAYGDKFLRFAIVPFIERPEGGYPRELCFEVTCINHDLPQLKFAVDGDGQMELLYDLPDANCDQTRFDKALQLMADYATMYYVDLHGMIA